MMGETLRSTATTMATSASSQGDPVVIVTGSHGQRLDLSSGQQVRFGSCSCHECSPHIVVPVPLGHWLRGTISAQDDHWSLSNLSLETPLTVRNLEDELQQVSVPPGRLGVVVPFELSALGAPAQDTEHRLTVFAHEAKTVQPSLCHSELGQSQVRLTPGALHTLVLEELVEASSGSAAPPTSREIVTRLERRGVMTSQRAVDRHIEYLFRRLFPGAVEDARGRPGWKRRAVAAKGTRTLLGGR